MAAAAEEARERAVEKLVCKTARDAVASVVLAARERDKQAARDQRDASLARVRALNAAVAAKRPNGFERNELRLLRRRRRWWRRRRGRRRGR